jgi:hypothetical protein
MKLQIMLQMVKHCIDKIVWDVMVQKESAVWAPALSARNVDRNIIENGIADVGIPVFKKILTPEEITTIINFLKS